MAESVSSIRSRIAALNIEQVHTPTPGTRPHYTYEHASTVAKKAPPLPHGQRPQLPARLQTVNNPPIYNLTASSARNVGNQPAAPPSEPRRSPAIPPRPPPRTTPRQAPSLPPRRPSEHALKKKASADSIATVSSSISALSIGPALTKVSSAKPNGGQKYLVRAPTFDPTMMPPLPVKHIDDPKQTNSVLNAMKSVKGNVSKISPPPQLLSRPSLPARPQLSITEDGGAVKSNGRVLPVRSALSFGMNKESNNPPPIPTTRPAAIIDSKPSMPPPIPRASRPNLDAIMASKPKPRPSAGDSCLICRDFSRADSHAAQFPRTSLPSSDVGWLAAQLTAPFPSATDKARTIFVWLHHNVDYDCHSFFSGTVSRSTPERTITSGLAVCEGYAGLFAALAVKAGLECIVVGGHGKGYGHSALKWGDPIPAFNSGHAWNAVRIDNGEWKLIDACWGAGSLGCNSSYNRHFTASEFTRSNNDFGYTHYPQDPAHLFRTDGRIYTWEDYLKDDMGERLTIYGDPAGDHGIGLRTFQPPMMHIKIHDSHDPVIRFQFAVVCPHWDHERNGKGKSYLMTLNIGGRDGRDTQRIPFNTDGKVWWLDVDRLDLGAPGQKVNVCNIIHFDGRDARGLTIEQYKAKSGRCSQQWSSVCMWELV